MKKYSATTGGFYDTAIHGNNIPADAVEITDEQHAALLEGQSSGKIISADASGAPVLTDPAKATAAEMWTAIKAERDRRKENGGYKVAVDGVDKWFHSDTFSRSQQLGLVLMGSSIPNGLLWKTMDGSYVTMTAELAASVLAAATAQEIATFTAAETHKATMETLAVPSDYDFFSGWPTVFGE